MRLDMDVWCAIRTYPKHALELGNPIPQEPVFFLKPSSSIIGFGQIDTCGGDVHHEIELVLKIGDEGIPSHMALGLDLTKRSVQDHLKSNGLPWAEAKAFSDMVESDSLNATIVAIHIVFPTEDIMNNDITQAYFFPENKGLIKHVLNSDINYWEKVRQV